MHFTPKPPSGGLCPLGGADGVFLGGPLVSHPRLALDEIPRRPPAPLGTSGCSTHDFPGGGLPKGRFFLFGTVLCIFLSSKLLSLLPL